MPKFNDYTASTAPNAGDLLLIKDVVSNSTKKITRSNLLVGTALPTNTVTTAAITDNSVTAAKLATSAITLGYTERTSTFNTSSTSITDITTLSVTVTVPSGGRRCKITGYLPYVSNGGASNNAYTIYIREGATVLTTCRGNIDIAKAEGPIVPLYSSVLSAGSHTYKLSIACDAVVSTDLPMSATSPGFILVEAI